VDGSAVALSQHMQMRQRLLSSVIVSTAGTQTVCGSGTLCSRQACTCICEHAGADLGYMPAGCLQRQTGWCTRYSGSNARRAGILMNVCIVHCAVAMLHQQEQQQQQQQQQRAHL
jgi:hypothetical protein